MTTKTDRATENGVVREAARAIPHLPRIQLTWMRADGIKWKCRYDLLIPVDGPDIRNHEDCGFVVAEVGHTTTTPGRDSWSPVGTNGEIDTPFRDGAHAAWDSHRLGWPAYVVCGSMFQLVEAKEPPPPMIWPETEEPQS